jgi:hypothetical protein
VAVSVISQQEEGKKMSVISVSPVGTNTPTLDELLWAARYGEPMPTLPPATVRHFLRTATGVPLPTVAVVVGVAPNTLALAEKPGHCSHRLHDSLPYLRVLAFLLSRLRETNPDLAAIALHLTKQAASA